MKLPVTIKRYILTASLVLNVSFAQQPSLPQNWNNDSQAVYDLIVAQLQLTGVNYAGSVDTLVKFAQQEKNGDLYGKAVKALLQTERYSDAIKITDEWAKTNTKEIAKHLHILALTLNNEIEQAYQKINTELESIEPEKFNEKAYQFIQILMTHWHKPQTLSLFEKIYSQYPNNHMVSNTYIELLRWYGDIETAISVITEKRFNDPKNVELMQKQSDIYRYSINLQEAEKVWTDVLNDYPHEPLFRFAYAQFLFDRYDFVRTHEQLSMINDKELKKEQKTLQMMALVQQQQYQKAIDVFDKNLSGDEGTQRSRYTLAEQLMQQKQYSLAQEILTPLVDFTSDNTDPLTYAAATQIGTAIYAISKENELDKGDQWFEQIAAHFKLTPEEHLQGITSALAESGHDKTAYQRLSAFLKNNPNHESVRYTRGLIAADSGMNGSAIKDLEIIHTASPEDLDVQNALGYTLLSDKKRSAEGMMLIKKALFTNPSNPAITDSMGWVYYNDKKYNEALPYLRFSYINYLDGEIIGHYILALYESGNIDLAKKLYQLEIQYAPNVKKINKYVGSYISKLKK